MNTKRFILGVISSALFAVGLARAADLVDPIGRSLPNENLTVAKSAPDSDTSCWVIKPAPDSDTSCWIDTKGN